ncbi:hypothetical protein HaLaN_11124 [Haematococcus lacustris]|uniref:Uncharacterized protein n=1 Tax=Haematococcus lacustris TaxID=44745 RepID=A0A699Z747_HAELA|nr:hypothetical protein HaLaN_11124 [Haematococcus lacustris]
MLTRSERPAELAIASAMQHMLGWKLSSSWGATQVTAPEDARDNSSPVTYRPELLAHIFAHVHPDDLCRHVLLVSRYGHAMQKGALKPPCPSLGLPFEPDHQGPLVATSGSTRDH